ncbi:hypothetical protein [Clostridium tagluense]|uniref:hypothetical protein n=1 Tax=Clostridium tagluense TaxID=360422 RepID=UPI001C6F4D22|nr:hypothetical protein [Clostridium tagluense]MBW9157297.1 hypothetical protein [Clostridium tagluense]WLC67598.1 hypothetical protein KTC93_10700 [Clostridium tagluense]
MKIKMSSTILIVAFIWIIVAVMCIVQIMILSKNPSFLIIVAPIIILTFAGAIVNSINFYMLYKDFLTLKKDSIIENCGLVFKKKVLNLSDIKNVKYNKNSMIFYMMNGRKKRISLLFISKSDEIVFYNFLTTNSINIVT